MDVDVLIIGGGPAGSYLARFLVNNGFGGDVMLIDKRSVVYAPVICGELLPTEDLLGNWIPKPLYGILLETMRSTLRREFIVNELGSMRLIVGDADVGVFPFRTYLIDKGAMIKYTIEEAEGKGARIKFGVNATRCIDRHGLYECLVHDKTNGEYVIRAKVLVGADAYPSVVDKSFGITNGFRPEDLIVATSARARGGYEDDTVILVMDPGLAPGGFAWIFPRGDGKHNIGVGVRNNIVWSGVNPLDYHIKFTRRFRLEQDYRSTLMKTLPVGGLLNRYHLGNAYLIGDAVGSVIPTNGAGINPAMITAHLLGMALIKGLDYAGLMNSVFRPLMDRMVLFRRIGDPLLMSRDAMLRALGISRSYLSSAIYEATLSSTRLTTLIKFLVGYPLIRLVAH